MYGLYLKELQLLQEYREIKPFSVKFQPGINIIVGENGSGKSSLLDLIANFDKSLCKLSVTPGAQFRFFDTEKMNPRIKSETGPNVRFEVGSRFISHGETMLLLLEVSKEFKDLLLLIDEPETGISLKNQKKLYGIFKKAVDNNCQIIIATHSYVLIKSVESVYNLDKKEWVVSKAYLKKVCA